MPANQVHYEIYLKKGRKSGWSLVEALDDRAKALEKGKALLEGNADHAVKVTKETFKADGDFLTITIFEQGFSSSAKEEEEEKEVELPCFRPADLYSVHARETIARALEGPLGRWKITVSELMHHAPSIERLELAGTELQHAVQKVSVIQAEDRGDSVQKVVKLLNELVFKAIDQVHKDARKNVLTEMGDKGLAAFAAKVKSKGDAGYRVRGAIASHLADCKDWGSKFDALMALSADAPEEGEVRDLCLGAIDDFVSEILTGKVNLDDVLGDQPDFGSALSLLTEVFIGEAETMDGARRQLRTLSRYMKTEALPATKSALAARILKELRHGPRLYPQDLAGEVKLVRKLASRIVLGQGPHLSVNDISDAFARRSRRFVTPEAITEYLDGVNSPVMKVLRLLEMEENLVGPESRRELAGYITPVITSAQMETFIVGLKDSSVRKLQNLARLQSRVQGTHFDPDQKHGLVTALDTVAVKVEERLGLLAAIERQPISVAEKVMALLRLAARGVLTQGECAMRAKRAAAKLMRDPLFMEGFVKGGASAVNPQQMLAELKDLMKATGLNGNGMVTAPAPAKTQKQAS